VASVLVDAMSEALRTGVSGRPLHICGSRFDECGK
jgi:hypothetical protein